MEYVLFAAGFLSGVGVIGLWVLLADERARRKTVRRSLWLERQFLDHRKTLENTNVRWITDRRR